MLNNIVSKLADGGNTELLSKLDRTPKANRDHDEGEPKSPLKTQRMINLEKQLHETKELVIICLLSVLIVKGESI